MHLDWYVAIVPRVRLCGLGMPSHLSLQLVDPRLARCVCPCSDTEFYSDAKALHEDVDGMVWTEAFNSTEGGT